METYIALVCRCPGLSDGAKVTLTEMLLHFDRGKLPSLNELKRIRNTSRSTIQKHLSELVEMGVLRKSAGEGNRVVYKLRLKKLLRLNGLKRETQVKPWIWRFAAVESKNPDVVESLTSNPRDWQPRDAMHYFDLLGRRKDQKCKRKKSDNTRHLSLLRKVLTEFGGKKTKLMLEFFADNFVRMKQEYDAETFFKMRSNICLRL